MARQPAGKIRALGSLVLIVGLVVGVAGCGEGTAKNGADEALVFVADDIDWAAAPSQAPAGEVAFELVNDDDVFHDLTVEELGDQTVAEADPGVTDTGTVALEPGDYTFYCSVPGHREAGMEATVAVTGETAAAEVELLVLSDRR